jgi:hypothetical protein
MSALPLILLGGAALLMMGKKKKTTSSDEGYVPQIPELPERPDQGEPEDVPGEGAGPQVGDTVESGIRRDRTGAHNWVIKLAESGYTAMDLPTGAHGPRDEIGFSETVAGAKKILSDFYNEALADADGHRPQGGGANARCGI